VKYEKANTYRKSFCHVLTFEKEEALYVENDVCFALGLFCFIALKVSNRKSGISLINNY